MSRKRQKRRKPVKTKSLLDICILVHGRFDLLTQCIQSIPDAVGDISYHVYLWDNASPDKAIADEFYAHPIEHTTVIRNSHNAGFPKGCNAAASRGKSPLIFFLNSDVILHSGSIDKLVRIMDEPKVGVAGMKLVFPEEHAGLNPAIRPAGRLQHIGLSSNIRAEITHPFISWSPDHPKVMAMADKEPLGVTGAALMTRRNLWTKAKGFFDGYGRGTYEDIDYCMTVREMGYNIAVDPQAVGIHYVGATAEKYNVPYNLHYNRMTFMQRWGEKLSWWDWRIL
jgi:GT2 family glycosyltransferase